MKSYTFESITIQHDRLELCFETSVPSNMMFVKRHYTSAVYAVTKQKECPKEPKNETYCVEIGERGTGRIGDNLKEESQFPMSVFAGGTS